MDHASIRRLSETLADIRARYGDARTIVREMRAQETTTTDAAYWIGVAQSFSKQVSDNLMALHDAIDRLEMATRPNTPKT